MHLASSAPNCADILSAIHHHHARVQDQRAYIQDLDAHLQYTNDAHQRHLHALRYGASLPFYATNTYHASPYPHSDPFAHRVNPQTHASMGYDSMGYPSANRAAPQPYAPMGHWEGPYVADPSALPPQTHADHVQERTSVAHAACNTDAAQGAALSMTVPDSSTQTKRSEGPENGDPQVTILQQEIFFLKSALREAHLIMQHEKLKVHIPTQAPSSTPPLVTPSNPNWADDVNDVNDEEEENTVPPPPIKMNTSSHCKPGDAAPPPITSHIPFRRKPCRNGALCKIWLNNGSCNFRHAAWHFSQWRHSFYEVQGAWVSPKPACPNGPQCQHLPACRDFHPVTHFHDSSEFAGKRVRADKSSSNPIPAHNTPPSPNSGTTKTSPAKTKGMSTTQVPKPKNKMPNKRSNPLPDVGAVLIIPGKKGGKKTPKNKHPDALSFPEIENILTLRTMKAIQHVSPAKRAKSTPPTPTNRKSTTNEDPPSHRLLSPSTAQIRTPQNLMLLAISPEEVARLAIERDESTAFKSFDNIGTQWRHPQPGVPLVPCPAADGMRLSILDSSEEADFPMTGPALTEQPHGDEGIEEDPEEESEENNTEEHVFEEREEDAEPEAITATTSGIATTSLLMANTDHEGDGALTETPQTFPHSLNSCWVATVAEILRPFGGCTDTRLLNLWGATNPKEAKACIEILMSTRDKGGVGLGKGKSQDVRDAAMALLDMSWSKGVKVGVVHTFECSEGCLGDSGGRPGEEVEGYDGGGIISLMPNTNLQDLLNATSQSTENVSSQGDKCQKIITTGDTPLPCFGEVVSRRHYLLATNSTQRGLIIHIKRSCRTEGGITVYNTQLTDTPASLLFWGENFVLSAIAIVQGTDGQAHYTAYRRIGSKWWFLDDCANNQEGGPGIECSLDSVNRSQVFSLSYVQQPLSRSTQVSATLEHAGVVIPQAHVHTPISLAGAATNRFAELKARHRSPAQVFTVNFNGDYVSATDASLHGSGPQMQLKTAPAGHDPSRNGRTNPPQDETWHGANLGHNADLGHGANLGHNVLCRSVTATTATLEAETGWRTSLVQTALIMSGIHPHPGHLTPPTQRVPNKEIEGGKSNRSQAPAKTRPPGTNNRILSPSPPRATCPEYIPGEPLNPRTDAGSISFAEVAISASTPKAPSGPRIDFFMDTGVEARCPFGDSCKTNYSSKSLSGMRQHLASTHTDTSYVVRVSPNSTPRGRPSSQPMSRTPHPIDPFRRDRSNSQPGHPRTPFMEAFDPGNGVQLTPSRLVNPPPPAPCYGTISERIATRVLPAEDDTPSPRGRKPKPLQKPPLAPDAWETHLHDLIPRKSLRRVCHSQKGLWLSICESICGPFETADDTGKESIFWELLTSVKRFLYFTKDRTTTRGAHKIIRDRARGVFDEPPPEETPGTQPLSDRRPGLARAERLVKEGALGRGARSIDTKTLPPHPVDIQKGIMKRVHPDGPTTLPPNPDGAPRFADLDMDYLEQRTRSLPRSAAPGPSGWTRELLLPLMESETCQPVIAALLLGILNNTLSKPLQRSLGTSLLILLTKEVSANEDPDGRPIAMGELFTKLAACIAFDRERDKILDIFGELQFGALKSQGVEIIILNTRREFRSNRDLVMATLDMRNAFNALHRDVMMAAVYSYGLNDLFNIVEFLYGSPSALLSSVCPGLQSKQGVRQGDPLGPILFAIGIHPLLTRLAKHHPLVRIRAYLDDVVALGPPQAVADFLTDFTLSMGRVGLDLNHKKSKIATHSESQFEPFASLGVVHTPGGQKVLGAFVAINNKMESDYLDSKVHRMKYFFSGLTQVDRQCSYTLFRYCGLPRWTHLTRTHAPDTSQHANELVDELARQCLTTLMGGDPSSESRLFANPLFASDLLASVSFVKLAPLAYKACLDGVNEVPDAKPQHDLVASFMVEERAKWLQEAENASPVTSVHAAMLTAKGSRLWLECRPNRAEYFMKRDHWEVAIRIRYLIPPSNEKLQSCVCGHQCLAQDFVIHALSCNKVSGYTWASRHALAKKIFKNVLAQYGFRPDNKEPRFNGEGPDVSFMLGSTLILVDLVICNPLSGSYVDAEAKAPGATLERAEVRKNYEHLDAAQARLMDFYPLALTIFGQPGRRSIALLRKISRYTATPAGFMQHVLTALAVAVQTGNAQMVLAATYRWWQHGIR